MAMPETDASEPETAQEDETHPCVTLFEANNADTQSLVLGRHDEPQELTQPELNEDNLPVYVRRWYEPKTIVTLPGSLTRDEAREWIDDHREHPKFENYDWRAHDEADALATVVNNRDDYRSFLSHIYTRLEEVSVVGIEAKEQLGDVREEIADVMTSGPAVEIDRVEKPEEAEA